MTDLQKRVKQLENKIVLHQQALEKLALNLEKMTQLLTAILENRFSVREIKLKNE